MEILLNIKELEVALSVRSGVVRAVNKISFKVYEREIIAIVGESGSGKSVSMMAIMGLLPKSANISGSVRFCNQELLGLATAKLNKIRGNQLAMIFQDPMTALNPYLTIQSQMTEVLILHKGVTKAEATSASIKLLDFAKIPDAKNRILRYPHEFSGGMRQRVLIAMSLLCNPKVLIADEPTTALDVTVQAEILQLLKDLKYEFGTSIILITHDMGVVAATCDRVNVMYGGSLMETADITTTFNNAAHPYTKALLATIPNPRHRVNKLETIAGEPPSLLNLGIGCPFKPRCNNAIADCDGEIKLAKIANRHVIKCINHTKKPMGQSPANTNEEYIWKQKTKFVT